MVLLGTARYMARNRGVLQVQSLSNGLNNPEQSRLKRYKGVPLDHTNSKQASYPKGDSTNLGLPDCDARQGMSGPRVTITSRGETKTQGWIETA